MMNINEFQKKQILFIFLNEGEKVAFSNDNIVVRDSQNKIKHQSTCYRIFAVFLIGNVTVTSVLIRNAHRFGFPVVLMTGGMRVYDVVGHKMEGNVLLRRYQYAYNDMGLARHIVVNKIQNQRWTLNQQRDKSESLKDTIKTLDQYIVSAATYEGELAGLIGIEGSAARLYFKNHFNNVEWQGRKPRIKNDYVNSALDIGYTILFNVINALLNLYGFDVYCGVLHRQFYMRKSLVCDLVEPFRPLVDMQIKKAINLKQFNEKDFLELNGKWQLKWEKSREYTAVLMQPLLERKDELFLYIQSYYRCFMKHKPEEQFPVFRLSE